jgi:flagellar biosynthesis repressor protein FlbT
MPLTINLRPGERLMLNGAVLSNNSAGKISLNILNKATVLHERDILLPEDATTDLKQLYLLVQMMHIEPDNYRVYYEQFIKLSAAIYAERDLADDFPVCGLVTDLITLIAQRDFVTALSRLKQHIGRPGTERLRKTLANNQK